MTRRPGRFASAAPPIRKTRSGSLYKRLPLRVLNILYAPGRAMGFCPAHKSLSFILSAARRSRASR